MWNESTVDDGKDDTVGPLWMILTWLTVMLVVIWGGYAGTGTDHTDSVGSSHETPVGTAGAESAVSWTSIVNPTKNNREDALRGRGLFPCRQCHNLLVTNPTKKSEFAKPHEEVRLDHGEVMACLTCHSDTERDRLVLVDGTEVSFNESHRVCGGCHGPVYRDWRHGAHGQRTGYMDGEKTVWACVRCHHPHQPKFPPMKPLPPPPRYGEASGGATQDHRSGGPR